MPKKRWPNIFEAEINSVKYWVVDSRANRNGVRSGKREYFETKAQAEGRADVVRKEVAEHGRYNGNIPLDTRVDAIRAEETLKPYGKTIHEAVAFYVEHLKKQKQGNILLTEAVDKWFEGKEKLHAAGKYADESLKSARYRSNVLKKAFPGKFMNEITPGVFKDWLLPSKYASETMSSLKAIASEFFNWAIERKYTEYNPALTTRIRQRDKGEVEILDNDQVKALLKAADSCAYRDQALPYVLLGLFAGLRPTEAENLKWKAINFETNEIRVEGYGVRYVPINPDLTELLKEFSDKNVRIIRENWQKNWQAVKRAAGFNLKNKYPHDCLRHSFASYWLAIHNNRARLAEIMGNSEKVIKTYYRRAIPKADAVEFWGIISAQDVASNLQQTT